jgi:hypothetical protein
MNVEIGAEAVLFPEKEYINGIAIAVYLKLTVDCWSKDESGGGVGPYQTPPTGHITQPPLPVRATNMNGYCRLCPLC